MPVGISGRGPLDREQPRAGDERRERDRDHERQERDAGAQWRVAERPLQVVREEERDAEDADAREEERDE